SLPPARCAIAWQFCSAKWNWYGATSGWPSAQSDTGNLVGPPVHTQERNRATAETPRCRLSAGNRSRRGSGRRQGDATPEAARGIAPALAPGPRCGGLLRGVRGNLVALGCRGQGAARPEGDERRESLVQAGAGRVGRNGLATASGVRGPQTTHPV